MVDTGLPNNAWAFKEFIDSKEYPQYAAMAQELAAFCNRGYLEYPAAFGWIRERDKRDGFDLQEYFQRTLCDLREEHNILLSMHWVSRRDIAHGL